MANCPTIAMDGTFDTCPNLFDQIYTIHGRLKSFSFYFVLKFSISFHVCLFTLQIWKYFLQVFVKGGAFHWFLSYARIVELRHTIQSLSNWRRLKSDWNLRQSITRPLFKPFFNIFLYSYSTHFSIFSYTFFANDAQKQWSHSSFRYRNERSCDIFLGLIVQSDLILNELCFVPNTWNQPLTHLLSFFIWVFFFICDGKFLPWLDFFHIIYLIFIIYFVFIKIYKSNWKNNQRVMWSFTIKTNGDIFSLK